MKTLDRAATFVDEPVMAAAEQDEVVDAGLASMRPVVDVVGVDETVVLAPREAAAAVATSQRPA